MAKEDVDDLTIDDAIAIIENEVKFYQSDSIKITNEYEQGFVKGLSESIAIINRFKKELRDV